MRKLLGRYLQLSDGHGGHLVGLTAPEFWSSPDTKWGKTQRECWNFFVEAVDKHKPYDLVDYNGDLVAGKNRKQGARDLITADMKDQCRIGIEPILQAECKRIRMQRGTAYHVGAEDNWENVALLLLKDVGNIDDVQIHNHYYADFCGKIIDIKHKLASSGIPHGRSTALDKEVMWARIWAATKNMALPNLLIRSHVHYFKPAGDEQCPAYSTPSLQGLGDEHAELSYSGTVDFGILVFNFYDEGPIECIPEIMKGVTDCQQLEHL